MNEWIYGWWWQNLTKWGGALLELSQFSEPRDSEMMIKGTDYRILMLIDLTWIQAITKTLYVREQYIKKKKNL